MAIKRHLMVGISLLGTVFLMGANVAYYEEALPSTMNPLFARSMVDHRTHELVYDRLYYRSAITNELKSRVVESHEVLEGGKKLKVVLKKGIKWHDGKSLSGDDVCFTIDAMLNPRTASPVAKQYSDAIAGCRATSKDNSATIEFKKLYHNPRERIGFAILPKHLFKSTVVSPDTKFSQRPMGTGPMQGTKGRRAVSFVKYPNLHHNARIDNLTLQEGGDPLGQVRTLINGGVQGVIAVPPSYRPDVAASDDVALKSYDLRSWWFIAVNTHKGPLKDKRARQALNHTLNRTVLRELTIGIDKNDAHPPCEFVSGPFVQSSPYYNRQVPIVEKSDPAKAKKLMTDTGAVWEHDRWLVDGQPVSLRIGMNAALNAEAIDLLNQVANQLQQGGFPGQVYKVNSDEWNRKAVTGQLGDFDLLIGKWSFGLVEDVDSLFHTRAGGRGAMNIFNYSNPEVNAILDQYETARTDTEARDAYHELHKYLADDLPYLFLWKLDTKSAWRNEVRGNTIAPYYYFTEYDGWSYN